MFKNKKTLLIISIVVLAVGVIAAAWFFAPGSDNNSNESSSPNNEADTLQIEDGETEPTNPKADPPDPDTSGQSPDDVPVNEAASLSISQLEQTDNEVTLNSSLSGADQAGTCVASFTHPGGRPVIREFPSNGQNGCGSLTIPAIEFSALGEWQLTLRFYNEGEQVIARESIVIT